MVTSSQLTMKIIKACDPHAYNLVFFLGCLPAGTTLKTLREMTKDIQSSKIKFMNSNEFDLAIDTIKQFNLYQDDGNYDTITLSPFTLQYVSKLMNTESKKIRYSIIIRYYS